MIDSTIEQAEAVLDGLGGRIVPGCWAACHGFILRVKQLDQSYLPGSADPVWLLDDDGVRYAFESELTRVYGSPRKGWSFRDANGNR